MIRLAVTILGAFVATSPAWAGDVPLYEQQPAWITVSDLQAANVPSADAPLMLMDNYQRAEDGKLWIYSDTATRVSSVEMLGQLSSLALPWTPDKGDLIVHEASLTRGTQRIDLLAAGKRFTVLRREEALEQQHLTGVLTATLAVEGAQVGDILRLRYSVTMRDEALGEHVRQVTPLIAAPLRVGSGQVKLQWKNGSGGLARVLASGVTAAPVKRGEFTEIVVPLPIAKQPDMPQDAPPRFLYPPVLEFSTFKDWSDVSRTMEPLFRTQGLIPAEGELAAELVKLKAIAGESERAQSALQLVQDRVRYLAISMNGGNYVPQTPGDTWKLLYGDCKAKTLLLLALLRESGIQAEAVLASSYAGDFVPKRLPSAAAFDHVLVHATIDGKDAWLDGTGSGTRIQDLFDTPQFGNVLPLRPAGADLLPIALRKIARPTMDITLETDESTSVDLPSVFKTKVMMRGPAALGFNLMAARLDLKQRNTVIKQFLANVLGEAQFADIAADVDAAAATVTISAQGVATTNWKREDKRRVRQVSSAMGRFEFNPDRSRPSWQALPVATTGPDAVAFHLRLRLPENGRGIAIEGEPDATEFVAGRTTTRTLTRDGGAILYEDRLDFLGTEIAAADIPAQRARLTAMRTRLPRLVAPEDAMKRWDIEGKDPQGATQLAAILAVYAKSIAEDEPDDTNGYVSRANLLIGIGDRKGALPDLDKIIAIAPNAENYMRRATVLHALGRQKEAIADAEKALSFDESSIDVIKDLTDMLAESGNMTRALVLLDKQIELGGDASDNALHVKADLLGDYGDPRQGLAIADDLMAKKPGSPMLLNTRCWIKATRNIEIDSALKDCTSAIELSSYTAPILDSRALVWFRLGRFEDALRDLDAVVLQAPSQGPSRYLRGLVLNRLSRPEEAAKELRLGKRLEPRIEAIYARYGIKP